MARGSAISRSIASHVFLVPSGHLIRSILSPAYTRLYLQAQALLQDHGLPLPPPEETSALEDGQPFSSFHEARDKLYEILCDAYSFKRILEEEKRKTKGRKATQPPKRRLPPIQAVAQWSVNLDKMFETQPHLKEKTGALALRIWLNTITIMVGMKDSDDETGFDRFTPAFTNIVDSLKDFTNDRYPYSALTYRLFQFCISWASSVDTLWCDDGLLRS